MLNNHLEELWLCFSNQMTSRHIPLLLSIILPTRANWSDHPHFKGFPSFVDLRWVYCKKKDPEGIHGQRCCWDSISFCPSPLYPGPTCLPQVFRSCPSAVPLPVLSMSHHGWITLLVSALSQKCAHMCMHEHAHIHLP